LRNAAIQGCGILQAGCLAAYHLSPALGVQVPATDSYKMGGIAFGVWATGEQKSHSTALSRKKSHKD